MKKGDPGYERALQKTREWCARNKDKVKEYRKRDKERNGPAIAARSREWRTLNRDKVLAGKKAQYWANPEAARERNNLYHSKNRDSRRTDAKRRKIEKRGVYALHSIKSGAKQDGVAFDLTASWMQERFDRGVCELSGLPFDFETKRGKNKPSVDRIVAGGPYTKENCRMILWSLNHALRDYGEDYMFDVFHRAIANHDAKKHQKLIDLGLMLESRSAYAGM